MLARRVFLTGEPGVGKTTIIREAIQDLRVQGLIVGGMVSQELRKGVARVGFQLEDLSTGEIGILASDHPTFEGPRIGRYTVNLADLEKVGAGAIQHAMLTAGVIVVDEIGPMELAAPRFVKTVHEALASRKHFLGSIHKRSTHPMLASIRSDAKNEVIEVTLANRNQLALEVSSKFK